LITDTEVIRKLDFFEPLEPKIIKHIAKMCIVREFNSGDYIVKRGESGLGLYFITRGRAKVEIDREGVKSVLAELAEGNFLGELSMIDDKERSADVVCLEDTSCLLLTRDSFSKLLSKHPEISLQLAKVLVSRIRATNEELTAAAKVTCTKPDCPVRIRATNDKGNFVSPAPTASLPPASSGSNGSSWLDFNALKYFSATKTKAKDYLVDLFSSWYVLKIMTRFSAVIMGCPIIVQPERRRPAVFQTSIAGVKLVLFPASGNQILRMAAFGDGEFSATVFRPPVRGTRRQASVDRFEGRICKNEVMRLHVPANRDTWLEKSLSIRRKRSRSTA